VTSTRRSLAIVCGVAAAATLGCQTPDEIQHYQVPREPRVRMLGAILPHGDRTWFIRMTGLDQELEGRKAEFRKFVESFRFDVKDGAPVVWAAPADWRNQEVPPNKRMLGQYAAFRVGRQEGTGPEVTVSQLGRKGQAGSVSANVNRWRGQLGLPTLEEAELEKATQRVKIGDDVATLLDMTGRGPYLVVRPAPGGPVGPHGGAGGPAPAEPGVAYQMPDGWRKVPNRPLSLATFRVGEGKREAEVTATVLNEAAGGVPRAVADWREQVGLPRAADADLLKDVRTLDLGSVKASYVEVVGPERSGERLAVLGALVTRPGELLSFRMKGPADVVAAQRANFEAFLRSLRFGDEKGGHP
jgi:hypothetical protein